MKITQQTPRAEWIRFALAIPLLVLLLLSTKGWSQVLIDSTAIKQANVNQSNDSTTVVTQDTPAPESERKVLMMADEMPCFKGGESAMINYISKNIKFPVAAKNARVEGFVIVRFVVDEKGKVGDAKVIRSLHPACDFEALKVISGMPNWIPGKDKGKTVAVYYTVPISFKLVR